MPHTGGRAGAGRGVPAQPAFTGKAGGPLADLAALVGEVAGVRRAPIEFDVKEGSG